MQRRNSQVHWLLTNIVVEMKSHHNFELTPSWFRQLKWWCFDRPCRIIETGMQLNNCLLYHCTRIFIGRSTNIDSPLMRLVPNYYQEKKKLPSTRDNQIKKKKPSCKILNNTYSLAFLPSQNAMLPYTIGPLTSTSFNFFLKVCIKTHERRILGLTTATQNLKSTNPVVTLQLS